MSSNMSENMDESRIIVIPKVSDLLNLDDNK